MCFLQNGTATAFFFVSWIFCGSAAWREVPTRTKQCEAPSRTTSINTAEWFHTRECNIPAMKKYERMATEALLKLLRSPQCTKYQSKYILRRRPSMCRCLRAEFLMPPQSCCCRHWDGKTTAAEQLQVTTGNGLEPRLMSSSIAWRRVIFRELFQQSDVAMA